MRLASADAGTDTSSATFAPATIVLVCSLRARACCSRACHASHGAHTACLPKGHTTCGLTQPACRRGGSVTPRPEHNHEFGTMPITLVHHLHQWSSHLSFFELCLCLCLLLPDMVQRDVSSCQTWYNVMSPPARHGALLCHALLCHALLCHALLCHALL